MNAYILTSSLLLLLVCHSSTSRLDICRDTDAGIEVFFSCVRKVGTPKLKGALDSVKKTTNCDSDLCLVRSLCAKGDLVTELEKHISEAEVNELVGLKQRCGLNSLR